VRRVTEMGAVQWVRRIRDAQAAALAGKSDAAIIRFFRNAARKARGSRRRGPRRKASA
jgi:hypothetical protein